ncbi:hypothetical protein LXA43DRAFT_1129756 [Ganoderma leucocontextum]|nr:hypothetical protein LXA43DRAFT_1129756 [Ganoderma leucocontextum]
MDISLDGDVPSPLPERQPSDTDTICATHSRRALGIVSHTGAPAAPGVTGVDLPSDAHIIINDDEGVVPSVGMEDRIVSLETNDDFAMGAPCTSWSSRLTGPGERTPRAGTTNLSMTATRQVTDTPARQNAVRPTNTPNAATNANGSNGHHHRHHHRELESGPYRDEDIPLSLQLLAYLSNFHPATTQLPNDGRFGPASGPASSSSRATAGSSTPTSSTTPAKDVNPFMKTFNSATFGCFGGGGRFRSRIDSSELELANPPLSLPPEIQYWAGVIMRNACRKDDSRGGIRQCANMLCGRWESFPREFAKCRRCRKAKYCGECQSTVWSEGHRFWCSAKDPEEDGDHHHSHAHGRGGRAERREARERERQARALAEELWLVQETDRVNPTSTAATVTAMQTAADAGTSTATQTTGAGASRTLLLVLAAALTDGTWTNRVGNGPPPQWLNDAANGQGADRSQRVASLLCQEPDIAHQQLARELMTGGIGRDNHQQMTTFSGHPLGRLTMGMGVEMSGVSPTPT